MSMTYAMVNGERAPVSDYLRKLHEEHADRKRKMWGIRRSRPAVGVATPNPAGSIPASGSGHSTVAEHKTLRTKLLEASKARDAEVFVTLHCGEIIAKKVRATSETDCNAQAKFRRLAEMFSWGTGIKANEEWLLAHVEEMKVSPVKKAPITVEAIKRVVAQEFGETVAAIEGPRRTRPLVVARQVSMCLSREVTGLSLPEVGRRHGNRDHTTALNGVRKARQRSQGNEELKARIEKCRRLILVQAGRLNDEG